MRSFSNASDLNGRVQHGSRQMGHNVKQIQARNIQSLVGRAQKTVFGPPGSFLALYGDDQWSLFIGVSAFLIFFFASGSDLMTYILSLQRPATDSTTPPYILSERGGRGVPWVLLREQLGRSDDGLRGFGGGPPTDGGEPSGYQALKPPQINIDSTKSLKYESFRSPKIGLFLADNRAKFTSRS